MFDAIDNYMKNTLIGNVVADRQGKIWAEVEAMAYPNPTGTFVPVMDITNRDWMNTPRIEERLTNDVSYLEYGGVAYSGNVTGTFNAYIGSAPGDAPGFYGTVDSHEGLALQSQSQLNTMLGNIYANKNSQFPSINIDASINAYNLDIAPQETLGLHIAQTDTVRNLAIDGLFIPNSMSWNYDPSGYKLLPQIDSKQLVNGFIGQTVTIPSQPDVGGGFSVNPLQFPPTPLTFPPIDTSTAGGDSAPSRVIVHDPTAGLIYTTTFNLPSDQVGWFQGNGGLTVTQYQSVQDVVVCPNGAIYIANYGRGGDESKTFLARSPGIGQPFTVLLDAAAIQAIVGAAATIASLACNPTVAEQIFYALERAGENFTMYIGQGSSVALTASFDSLVTTSFCNLSFGGNQWLLTGSGKAFRFSSDGSLLGSSAVGNTSRHTRGGILSNTIHWVDSDTGTGPSLGVGTNNASSYIASIGNSNVYNILYFRENGLVCDPTGVFMMTSNNSLSPIKSSDGGYSWSQMTFLAPLVFHYFANCGDTSRWIAVAGSQSPYFSPDFGVNWYSKWGNMAQINALPVFDIVKVLP
jgi:hypothetical protein